MKWLAPAATALALSLSVSSASAYKAFVSNEKGNTITVVDTETTSICMSVRQMTTP